MYQHPLLLMAPRRDSTETVMSSSVTMQQSFSCCLPTGECLKANTLDFGLISTDQLHESVKVICSNENCTAGQYMHAECFEQWEQSVLNYLKSIGRARSWSDKQRQQNLWTKKGYDLVYKVCGCRCGRGHIKKDLDWAPPITAALFGGGSKLDEECNKKKKKKNRNNQKPALTSTPSVVGQTKFDKVCNLLDQQLSVSTPPQSTIRGRAGSLTSSNGSSSPASSGNDDLSAISVSPIQNHRAIIKRRYIETAELYSDRIRWVNFFWCLKCIFFFWMRKATYSIFLWGNLIFKKILGTKVKKLNILDWKFVSFAPISQNFCSTERSSVPLKQDSRISKVMQRRGSPQITHFAVVNHLFFLFHLLLIMNQ